MSKPKVLILYNFILHYRVPFFNELTKHYDVTVLHSGDYQKTKEDNFRVLSREVKKLGPFFIQSGVIKECKSDYDIVISLFDIRWLSTLIYLSFFKRKNVKHILWGAWLTKSKIANFLRLKYMQKATANVFYTYSALDDFKKLGLDGKSYVANNTFDVKPGLKSYENTEKDLILNVGSLNKRKQNDILIKAFFEIIDEIPDNINLTFIGTGGDEASLRALTRELGIEQRVEFIAPITSADVLKSYYRRAIVSASFGQAGLSVLQSMGFGVPFLTSKGAISGGEITNIKNEENGILVDDLEDLKRSLKVLCNDMSYSKKLGKAAYQYYFKYCTISNMVAGFLDSINSTNTSIIDKRK
ncbi:glycosyltransferase family 4 protein [Psychrosphaera ytuae]|uniref:Glycosyltransferase family 4 protein n=1 Tax=Psychrosphaera ytuae TaxID=2820710 RepID=A0A975DCL0_9GAMM|nr:glycosyltransferase family 4 protein [Psychrosphaera ytuae]QTH64626.1 glycosyltransferase family 4 protein [Psychrosphaera ytuae]